MNKHRLTTLALVLMALFGLALLLYPTVANLNNERHSSKLIASYVDQVAELSVEDYTEVLAAARRYNEAIRKTNGYALSEELMAQYNAALNVTGLGIMGYVDIPRLEVSLPIYHGTAESVLQIAAGHLEWTDLPIGGQGNHSVISGHRGLPSAKLFTDLPKMEVGDQFYIRVLNEVLSYEVDQIVEVLPYEITELARQPGKDYCTLMTCTPYGINTHRLLVRGHRIETNEAAHEAAIITAEAVRLETLVVAPFIAAPILLVLFFAALAQGKKKDEED